MKMNRIWTVIFTLILLFCVPGWSALDLSTYEFMLLEPDGRSVSLAGAVHSRDDSVWSAFWNPASLAHLDGLRTGYGHHFLFSDLNFDVLAGSWNLGKPGSIGLYLNTLSMAEKMDAIGVDGISLNRKIKTGFFSANLVYAYGPIKMQQEGDDAEISFGTALKILSQKLDITGKTAWAMDLAVHTTSLFVKDLNFGLVLQNLGPGVSLPGMEQTEQMPTASAVGISYREDFALKGSITLSLIPGLDATIYPSYPVEISVGAEGILQENKKDMKIFLRTGYSISEENPLNGLRFGTGVEYKDIGIDYGISVNGEVGLTHRMSISYLIPGTANP